MSPTGDGFAVALASQDPARAKEILRRARMLGSPPRARCTAVARSMLARTAASGDAPLVSSAWRGRVFLGTGDMLYAGPVGPTAAHAHHAFQLVATRAGEMTLRSGSQEAACDVAVVPSDVEHAVTIGCVSAVMLYVDPDGHDGRRLRKLDVSSAKDPSAWRRAGEPLSRTRSTSLPTSWTEAEALRRTMIEALVGSATRPKAQHPALVRAVRRLPELLDRPLRLVSLAAELGISESRLAHLFGSELGLPFACLAVRPEAVDRVDRKSTRLNSSH